MANRTDPDADTVHGANPQFLVDRIIRVKIYNDAYWKEFCFGLTTESLIDEAARLDYVGGTYGGRRRPARFLCLFLKLLQIQPEEEVVMEYIKQPELKYLRALGCAYLRITARYSTIFQTFEPLFADYRKLRYRDMYGKISIIHMDEFVDWLLREETVCDVTMPQMPKREILEQTGQLQPYQSVLEDDLEDLEDLERSLQELQEAEAKKKELPSSKEAEAAKADEELAAKKAEPAEVEPETSSRKDKERRRSEEARRADDDRAPKKDKDRASKKDKEDPKARRVDEDRPSRRDKDRDRRDDEDRSSKKDKARRTDEDRGGKKEKAKTRDRDDDRKTKKAKYANKADEERAEGHTKKDKDGLSVDEWNEIRKGMGLKPLK